MRRARSTLLALGCCWLAGASAQQVEQQSPGPDLDFLEYLGTWAEEDDEWLAIEEWQKDNDAEPDEGLPDEDPEGSERQKDDNDEGE